MKIHSQVEGDLCISVPALVLAFKPNVGGRYQVLVSGFVPGTKFAYKENDMPRALSAFFSLPCTLPMVPNHLCTSSTPLLLMGTKATSLVSRAKGIHITIVFT